MERIENTAKSRSSGCSASERGRSCPVKAGAGTARVPRSMLELILAFGVFAGCRCGTRAVSEVRIQRPVASFAGICIPSTGTLPGVCFRNSLTPGLRQVDCQNHAGRPNTSHYAVLLRRNNGNSATPPQVRRLRTGTGEGSISESTQPPLHRRYPGRRGTR